MMNYWLYREAGGPVEGPFTADQLRTMAADGTLHPQVMVADDRGQWVEAGKVPALFPQPHHTAGDRSTTSPHESSYALDPTPLHEPSQHVAAPPFQAPPVAGAPPLRDTHLVRHVAAPGMPGRQRNMRWLLILTALLAAFSIVRVVMAMIEAANNPNYDPWGFDPNSTFTVPDYMGCFEFIAYIALWICWVVWLHIAYREVWDYTGGELNISPGLALGLCFVPLFNIFWQVYAPYQLALAVEREMNALAAMNTAEPPRAASPNVLLGLLIVGAIPGCCCGGLIRAPMFGITATLLQRNLNLLWSRAGAAGLAPPAYTHHP